MDAKTQILLVTALLIDQAQAASVAAAHEHLAFRLWSGVKTSNELKGAQTVHLHQDGVLVRSSNVVFQRLELPVSYLFFPPIWLTMCFTTLDVSEGILTHIIWLMQRWQTTGNHVIGLQVDFDAATHQLIDCARFPQQLRQQLPAEFAPGVTGLLDQAKAGDVTTLNALTVDELVVQSYQGCHTVTNYQAYLSVLSRLHIPFRLELVQNGSRDPLAGARLEKSPQHRGIAVFMFNPPRR